MYCPNCGQQQLSNEMRFCSRCGLALSGLMEWLAGGVAPVKREEPKKTSIDSPRRKGFRRAGKLMFFSAVLFPIFLIISIAVDEPGPLVIPFTLFFASLVWMLYARIFLDKNTSVMMPAAQTSALGSTSALSLPPPTSIPIPTGNRNQVRTNELAQPPSVTEHTTRLLDNE